MGLLAVLTPSLALLGCERWLSMCSGGSIQKGCFMLPNAVMIAVVEWHEHLDYTATKSFGILKVLPASSLHICSS